MIIRVHFLNTIDNPTPMTLVKTIIFWLGPRGGYEFDQKLENLFI